MNRNAFLGKCVWRLLVAACLLSFSQSASTVFAERRQPNVILILADDLGYGDLGCFGQQTLKTPRLDAMARQGMRFTQFYAGCAVCAPSRCVLLTGKHMGRTVVRGNSTAPIVIQPGQPTVVNGARKC
jgi:uncharacterized sulfatase